jgi:hypothetical protein
VNFFKNLTKSIGVLENMATYADVFLKEKVQATVQRILDDSRDLLGDLSRMHEKSRTNTYHNV